MTTTDPQIVFALPFISATFTEAAKATGISESTIRAAAEVGDLTVHYVGVKATKPVVDAVELFAWVRSLPTSRGRVAA